MGIILALDVGDKTIGTAFTDESEMFSLPGTTILRHEGYKRDMAVLRRLILERNVTEIVVGLPILMDGTEGIQVQKVRAFVVTLSAYTDKTIVFQDERLSTWEADQALIELGQDRKERKKTIDSLAAAAILQSFLDARKICKS